MKVLVIEDNPVDARLIRELLLNTNDGGIELRCVGRLSDGLAHLNSREVDLVILDLSLPDSQGLDTLYQVRAQAPQVPIVILSGLDDKELTIEAIRKGAQDYLIKGQVDSNILGRSLHYAIERKQADNERQQLYEREKSLRQELESEIEKRVEFTRALVHELKTPLTPILASSDLLVAELKEEPCLSLAKNVNRGALNLNKRINELLDLARGEVGMLKLRRQKVSLLELIREVVGDMGPVASSRGQSLILDLPPSVTMVLADEVRLRQIVLNLLNNACKFTPEGGDIIVRAKEEDANLIVEVQDTGPGISEEEQERLFQPYHRTESDRERLSGLGLGLALCKTLVELHKGQMRVTSKKGEGSSFGFLLPVNNRG